MKILLVEDDSKLGMLLQYKLNKECHNTDWARGAEEAENYMEAADYHLYILDWMLPGMSGPDLCRRIRLRGDQTPVLMLTAKDAVSDRVEGLNAGADDYLVKPFAFEELFARLKALDRRRQHGWNDEICRVGDLSVNKHTREVTRAEHPISLTRREYQLLLTLAENAGKVMTREHLLDQVWGFDADITLNAVDAAIKLLRKKIDDPFDTKMIQNVRGLGYKLATERS